MEKSHRVKLLKIFLLFIVTSTYLFSSISILNKVEVKKGELRLQFNQAYNKKLIKVFTLQNPTRKVFDIKNARLASKRVGRNVKSSHCRSIRVSQYKKNIIRVVLEVDRPYACAPYKPMFSYKSYHIPLPKYKSSKRSSYAKKNIVKPKKKKEKKKKTKQAKAKKVKSTPVVHIVKKEEPYIMPMDTSTHVRGGRIVIDAGHGGKDPGAIGRTTGIYEKVLALKASISLKKELEKEGFKVYLTRSTDEYISLYERANMANELDADLFVSVHINAHSKTSVKGVEVLYSPYTTQRSDVLAKYIVDELVSKLGAVNRGTVQRPNLIVIRETKMPAALVELGFLSNSEEEILLQQSWYLQNAVDANADKFFVF